MQVWRLIAHHANADVAIEWFRRASRIAVGWGRIGDLRKSACESPARITALIRRTYPEITNAHLGGPSLWRFYREMQVGDLVIVGDGHRRRLVMRVSGDYEWSHDPSPVPPGGYRHQRRAEYEVQDADDFWKRWGATPAKGESVRWTLFRVARR